MILIYSDKSHLHQPRGFSRVLCAKIPSFTAFVAREAHWNRRTQRFMATPRSGCGRKRYIVISHTCTSLEGFRADRHRGDTWHRIKRAEAPAERTDPLRHREAPAKKRVRAEVLPPKGQLLPGIKQLQAETDRLLPEESPDLPQLPADRPPSQKRADRNRQENAESVWISRLLCCLFP